MSDPAPTFVVPEQQFDAMFPERDPFYTYAGLVAATAAYPAFATTGGDLVARREAAAFLANVSHETRGLQHVTEVNTALFEKLSEAGVVPVLGSLSGDVQGSVFNINADTVATRVAAKLKAAKLFLVSNVPGVLANKDDPTTRLPTLTPSEAKEKIASGVIQGGMIPKVEESLAMLEEGIEAIHIVGISPANALLGEAEKAGSFGTAFLRG